MAERHASFYELVAACEAAIVRVRDEVRAGNSNSEAVGADLLMIQMSVEGIFRKAARSLRTVSPLAEEEAREALNGQLLEDILHDTYVSMAPKFGAYLKTMPINVVRRVRRNYVLPDASSKGEQPIAGLDQPLNEDGLSLHDVIADPQAAVDDRVIASEALKAGLAALSPEERRVAELRSQEVANRDIARELGLSEATTTRLWQSARQKLGQYVQPDEE